MDRITQMIWQRARSDYMESSMPEDTDFDDLDKKEKDIYYDSAASALSNEDAFVIFDNDDDEEDYY